MQRNEGFKMTKIRCNRENCHAVDGICQLDELKVIQLAGMPSVNILNCPVKRTIAESIN